MSLRATPGREVLPVWNELVAAVERHQILPGVGIRFNQAGGRTVISLASPPPVFTGAWKLRVMDSKSVRIGEGYVNGMMPVYPNGKELTHEDEVTAFLAVPETGDIYVVIEAGVDESGKLKIQDPKKIKADELSVRHTERPVTTGEKGQHPIAFRRNDQWHQLAYFDYQHFTRVESKGRIQHFFVPA